MTVEQKVTNVSEEQEPYHSRVSVTSDKLARLQKKLERPENGSVDEAIEKLIDRSGFQAFVTALQDVCYAKAQHMQKAWQDELLTEIWTERGNKVRELSLY